MITSTLRLTIGSILTSLNLQNGEELWQRETGNKVMPLEMRKQPSRPNINQSRKDVDEPRNPHKLRKSSTSQKCGKCGQMDHYKDHAIKEDVDQTSGAQASTGGSKQKGSKRK
ncbi:hypothetical protein FCV25MIE_02010 [Fagus crenata]